MVCCHSALMRSPSFLSFLSASAATAFRLSALPPSFLPRELDKLPKLGLRPGPLLEHGNAASSSLHRCYHVGGLWPPHCGLTAARDRVLVESYKSLTAWRNGRRFQGLSCPICRHVREVGFSSLPALALACICLAVALGQGYFFEGRLRSVLEKLREASDISAAIARLGERGHSSCTNLYTPDALLPSQRDTEEI